MGTSSKLAAGVGARVCPALPEPVYDTVSMIGNLTFEQLSLYISAAFMAVACLISIGHIFMHAMHLSNTQEQVRLIRIISIILFFAIIAFIDVAIGRGSIYLNPWLDVYESISLASFLLLLGAYISPDAEDRSAHLEGIKASRLDATRNGAAKFTRTWVAVFQFPLVALLVAVITDVTQATNTLCPNSNSVHFAHLWLTIVRLLSITVAVISILRLTRALRSQLDHQSIVKKLFAFKGIVFIYTIQNLVFTILGDQITSTDRLSYNDISNTISSLMLCVEMVVFAAFFLFAYPWQPYIISKDSPRSADNEAYGAASSYYQGGFLGLKGIVLALNPADIVMGIVTAAKLLTPGGRAGETSADYAVSAGPHPAMQDERPMAYQPQ